jgi:hypothetical protein
MEAAFGRSFGEVRVHTGAAGSAMADAHGAEALTVGRDIAFATGRYQPGTAGGDRLIAHELAHVAQGGSAGGAAAFRGVSTSSEPAEVAAEAAAGRAVAGLPVGSIGAFSTRGRLMRRARMGASLPSLSPGPPAAGLTPAPVPGGARARSTAVSLAANVGVGVTAGPAPAPEARRGPVPLVAPPKPAPPAKAPDEAQVAAPPAEPSPPSVMVAGAPVGATAEDAAAVAAGSPEEAAAAAKKAEDKKAEGDEKVDQKKGGKDAKVAKDGAEGEAKPAKKKKKRRGFGVIPGDRGAKAAAAAIKRLDKRSTAMRHHEPAGRRIGDAAAAVEPPEKEGTSRAQGDQVVVVADVVPPPPDAEGAKSAVRSAAEGAAPTNMEEVGELGSRTEGVAQALKDSVEGSVAAARTPLDAVQTPGPAPEPIPAVPQPDPEPAPGTAKPALAAATPPPVPDESLDASEFKEEAEETLAANDVDDETLAKANEGPLAEIAADKKDLDDAVESAPAEARAAEEPANAEAQGGLAGEEAVAQGGMYETRDTEQEAVSGEQDGVKEGQTLDRTTAAGRIEGLYQDAATAVNEKLDGLSEKATGEFDTRQKEHLASFVSDTERELDDFKDDRYSGAFGWARWLKDRFVSINEFPEVQAIYKTNYDRYIGRIDALIAEISSSVDTAVAEAKQILATAKAEIQTIVDELPAKMKADATAAQARAEQRFVAMEKRIAETGAQAKAAVAARRQKAIDEVDGALAKIKAANASLVDKIAAAIRAIVEFLGTFFKLMTRVTRMGVGAFVSAAGSQAKEGVQNHLWDALQTAFKEWLFSKMPFIEPLMNLPSNWFEMLMALGLTLPSLFMESLPEMLPAIGAAAMVWLATSLALKLIPGAGAIMAVIDGIRAAWGLIKSLISAAGAFFDFVLKVAQPAYAAAEFAMALARGIIAALAALLTFLGVDALIMRVAKAVAKPFGKVVGRVSASYKKSREERGAKRKRDSDDAKAVTAKSKDANGPPEARRRKIDDDDGSPDTLRRKAEDERRREERTDRRRQHRESRVRQDRERRRDPRERAREDPRKAREDQRKGREDPRKDRERRDRERLDKAVAAIRPRLAEVQRRGTSRLGLRARLTVWRLRYRLSSLSLSGNRIVASVNPADDVAIVRAIPPATIGAALEPILAEAERRFLAERLEDPGRMRQMEAAEEQISRSFPGEEIAAAREMEAPERVALIRRALARPGQLPMAYATSSWMARTMRRRPSARPRAAGVVLPGGRPGADIRVQHPAHGTMLYNPDAPDYRRFRQEHVESAGGQELLGVTETARAEGQFATRTVAEALIEREDIEAMEAAKGSAAPMGIKGSGRAADEDFRQRKVAGGKQGQQVATARGQRHERTGNVFQALAGVLRREVAGLELYGDPQQAALEDLAEAFRRWVVSNLSERAAAMSEEERQASTAALIASLVAFMRTRFTT